MSPSPQLQQYLQSNEEEPYYILKTNNPVCFGVPDGYDPDHFMPWVHLFSSVIAGPTGSGKSMFVRQHQTHDDSQARSDLMVLW